MTSPAALLHAPSYDQPDLRRSVFAVLDAACLNISLGQKILVKPNLLMPHELSCTNAAVVACACEWLLNHGARLTVADSPAFGSCTSVARAIGLTAMLKPLGLKPHNFKGKRRITLDVEGSPELTIASCALECDAIFSIPKVKAHSQMRVSLAVKNCYGCIPGMRKAIAHSRFGQSVEFFSQCVVSLWQQLPPVLALADGIIAMHVTGPRYGKPYNLGMLAAGAFAPAVDAAIMDIIGVKPEDAPLAAALEQRGIITPISYPLEKPENFAAPGFAVPTELKEISFNPLVLAKSVVRRIWCGLKGN